MLSSALITLAQKQFPDWSREMLREFLNELQIMIFTQNTTNQMMVYDPSTGKDPTITTDSGTYEYGIGYDFGFITDVWRVTNVYTSSIDESIPDIKFYDAQENIPAKIVFTSDPGNATYFLRTYRYPLSLRNEQCQLEIPSQYHITHVFEGLSGLIEKSRSGASDRWEKFEQKLLPELVHKMSVGSNRSADTPYRGF